jgi:hypothetical protein
LSAATVRAWLDGAGRRVASSARNRPAARANWWKRGVARPGVKTTSLQNEECVESTERRGVPGFWIARRRLPVRSGYQSPDWPRSAPSQIGPGAAGSRLSATGRDLWRHLTCAARAHVPRCRDPPGWPKLTRSQTPMAFARPAPYSCSRTYVRYDRPGLHHD